MTASVSCFTIQNKEHQSAPNKRSHRGTTTSITNVLYGHMGPQVYTVHVLLELEPHGVPSIKKLKSTEEDTRTGTCELEYEAGYNAMKLPLNSTLNHAIRAFKGAKKCVTQRVAKNQLLPTTSGFGFSRPTTIQPLAKRVKKFRILLKQL